MSTIEFSFPFFWKLNIQVYHELTVIASHCIYIHFFLCMEDTLQHRFCIVNFYIQTYFLLIIEVLNSMIHDAKHQFTITLFWLMYMICKQKHCSYRLNHCNKLTRSDKHFHWKAVDNVYHLIYFLVTYMTSYFLSSYYPITRRILYTNNVIHMSQRDYRSSFAHTWTYMALQTFPTIKNFAIKRTISFVSR